MCLPWTGLARLQSEEEREPAPLTEGGVLEGDVARAPKMAKLAAKAGYVVELRVEGHNFLVRLSGPDGVSPPAWEQWDFPCQRSTPLRLRWVVSESREFTLVLTPYREGAPAPFRLQWTRHAPATDADRRWDRAQSLVWEAGRALESGDAETAERSAREATRILKALGPDEAASRRLEALADMFWVQDWEFSRSLLATSADWRRSVQAADHPCLADTLSLSAALLKDHGLWDQALAAEREALEIRRRSLGEKHLDVGWSLYNLGVIFEAQARLGESERSFRGALEIFEASPEMQDQVPTVLYSLGEVLRQRNRTGEAGELFRKALDLAEKRMGRDDPALPRIMSSLGSYYGDRGELLEAERWLRRSLKLKEETGADPGAIANGALNVAEILRRQARYEEAEPLYLKALAEARKWMAASSPELVWFVNQAARFFQETNRPQRALELFGESVTLLRGQPRHPLLAQTLHYLANLQLELGEVEEARRNAARAVSIREEAFGRDHPEVATSLVLLARAQGTDEAEPSRQELLDRALAILEDAPVFPEVEMEALALRARLRRAEGRNEAAVRDLARSLEILEELRSLRGGGDLSRAALLAERLEDTHLLVRWHFEDGRPAPAIDTLERHRGRVFLDRVRLAGVDWTAGIPPEEWAPLREEENDLRARIAGYQQLMQRLLQDRSRREEVRKIDGELKRTLLAYRGLQERIRNASPIWRDRLSKSLDTASLADIQSDLLEDGERMLIYQVGEEGGLAALVPAGGGPVRVAALSIGAEESAVLGLPAGPLTAAGLDDVLVGRGSASVLGQLGDPQIAVAEVEGLPGYDSGPLLRKLNALWKILTPPEIWGPLENAGGVVVIPDAGLHLLPFEALVVSAGGDSADASFWLDTGPSLRYAPSATVLKSLRQRARQRLAVGGAEPSILSVSNPKYAGAEGGRGEVAANNDIRTRYVAFGGPLEPLPATARETEALVAAFGRPRVQILEAEEATEARVRGALPGKRYVHLATHGLVGEEESDLLASLALTKPQEDGPADDDGFLQLFEIYQLSLDAELTVLSACETNLGRRVAGEGVFALSSGFLVAGSSRVLASQWRVDDESTAGLIGSYFHEIAEAEHGNGAVSFSRALRDAKRQLRRRPGGAPPYFWAPFVLAGLN